jgi:hypothetical protein
LFGEEGDAVDPSPKAAGFECAESEGIYGIEWIMGAWGEHGNNHRWLPADWMENGIGRKRGEWEKWMENIIIGG